ARKSAQTSRRSNRKAAAKRLVVHVNSRANECRERDGARAQASERETNAKTTSKRTSKLDVWVDLDNGFLVWEIATHANLDCCDSRHLFSLCVLGQNEPTKAESGAWPELVLVFLRRGEVCFAVVLFVLLWRRGLRAVVLLRRSQLTDGVDRLVARRFFRFV